MRREPKNSEIKHNLQEIKLDTKQRILKLKKNDIKMQQSITSLELTSLEMQNSINRLVQNTDDIIDALHMYVDTIDKRFDNVDNRFDKIEKTMATKSYVDYKFADFKGDFMGLLKKNDKKTIAIVNKLQQKKLFNKSEANSIKHIQPFASA